MFKLKHPLALIIWDDAAQDMDDAKAKEAMGEEWVFSAGFLVHEDEKEYILARDSDPSPEWVRSRIRIAKVYIRHVIILSVPRAFIKLVRKFK